jgi:hypothetical protein
MPGIERAPGVDSNLLLVDRLSSLYRHSRLMRYRTLGGEDLILGIFYCDGEASPLGCVLVAIGDSMYDQPWRGGLIYWRELADPLLEKGCGYGISLTVFNLLAVPPSPQCILLHRLEDLLKIGVHDAVAYVA